MDITEISKSEDVLVQKAKSMNDAFYLHAYVVVKHVACRFLEDQRGAEADIACFLNEGAEKI
ncbi:MAG: hypothetical protein MUD10_05230, partial [Candidatus Pacebacteria bacterium]|nr:hypothetical protein [Candidatus Paceibacterota bacterium]